MSSSSIPAEETPHSRVEAGATQNEIGLATEATSAPAKKRARTSTSKANPLARVRGRKGALQHFNSMPFDILSHILSHLDPPSLLALTLTSRIFRAVLLADSTKNIWADAFEQDRVPKLASQELAHVQLANLLHNKLCHRCRKKNIHKVDFALRVRLCPACVKANFASGSIWHTLPGIHSLAPHSSTEDSIFFKGSSRRSRYYTPALKHFSDVLNIRFPGRRVASLEPYDKARFWHAYFTHEPKPDEDEGEEGQGWTMKGCCTALGAFLLDRQEVLEQRRRDAMLLEYWVLDRQDALSSSKEVLRQKRREDIKQRLLAEGWLQSDFAEDAWSKHKLVTEAKELTERAWKTVRPRLEEWRLHELPSIQAAALLARQRECCNSLKPGWLGLRDSYTPAELKICLPLYVYVNLSTVRPFWETGQLPSVDEWTAALPSILTEIASVQLRGKRTLFDSFVTAYSDAILLAPQHSFPPLPPFDSTNPTAAEVDSVLAHDMARCRCRGKRRMCALVRDMDYAPAKVHQAQCHVSRGEEDRVNEWAAMRQVERIEGWSLVLGLRLKELEAPFAVADEDDLRWICRCEGDAGLDRTQRELFSHFAEKHKPPQSFKGEWIYPTVDVKTLGPTRPRYPWETDSDDGNV